MKSAAIFVLKVVMAMILLSCISAVFVPADAAVVK